MLISGKRTYLTLAHIAIIALSNTLVQYPFALVGFKTTWGAFSYPLIFILTDLTTRLLGQKMARKIVYYAMVPGLVCSYLIANIDAQNPLLSYNPMVLRIAFASFLAYVLGQLLDIAVFQKFRVQPKWWVAPSIANIFGNFFDTYCFFYVAFFHSTNSFLSTHWVEIATVDLVFKLLISMVSFLPLYGFILKLLLQNNTIKGITVSH
ncbi:7-cyano-7-deazaguanine/7-aminomethyl-7-deazaguanine transporter [Legionella clemsonensis]|uniref:Probable queuosine precursor transporter n=1 Tax=Legionella clemsonensis TaxID=1867846 RepID=A0A222P6F0_9GAMM|nr:7-cyano-7-deazaguanine/7-aminomethyl-7-deazaguanine transporter [Legionella clemsonensis]ASQ47426.1 Inner membrane protein YhhQ [Legionella clemsonensis]